MAFPGSLPAVQQSGNNSCLGSGFVFQNLLILVFLHAQTGSPPIYGLKVFLGFPAVTSRYDFKDQCANGMQHDSHKQHQ
jgi:hypothetical protein